MKFHQHPKKISKIIKIILKNIPNNEFQQILIYLRELTYLKNIINVEIIFNFIIENALDKYKNNIYIQDSLYKIFEELTNINNYNLIIFEEDNNKIFNEDNNIIINENNNEIIDENNEI